MRYRTCIAACARWESDAIVEWLVYHRSIGFEHVFLYCNDDDPTELYEKVQPFLGGQDPFVTFVYFPFVGLQHEMYKHCLNRNAGKTEWLIFLDIDEFICLRQDKTILEFVRRFDTIADVIYLNWVMFGHNGHLTRPPGSVLLNYTRRSRNPNDHTKAITRLSALDVAKVLAEEYTAFWHKWDEELFPELRRVNVIGEDMSRFRGYDDEWRNFVLLGDRPEKIMAVAMIHHYAFRSEADLERRQRRGLKGVFGGQHVFQSVIDGGYIADFLSGMNEIEDTTLKTHWQDLLAGGYRAGAVPSGPGRNLALKKLASQSSVCEFSPGVALADDASRLVSGKFTGSFNNHTALEDRPWWAVDLGEVMPVQEIRIYNRSDHRSMAERAKDFEIRASTDSVSWSVLVRCLDTVFGGIIDGAPFIWRGSQPVSVRYIVIQLLRTDYLHFEQVEVYGTASQPPDAPTITTTDQAADDGEAIAVTEKDAIARQDDQIRRRRFIRGHWR